MDSYLFKAGKSAGIFVFALFLFPHIAAAGDPTIYQGAWVPDAQRNISKAALFENHSGTGISIIHWYQGWGVTDGTQNFQAAWMNNVRSHGSIPMITWEPWDYTKGASQPAYSLKRIINGSYDAYITKWALDSKAWGHPYFLRFAHEMNVDQYPWSERINGNSAGEYVEAWRHVRDIFTANNVNTVTWVWSPNVEYSGTIPLESVYPGDSYVDWLGMDGYNGGTALWSKTWLSFPQIFNSTYYHILGLSPGKPIMVAEVASAESGGSKSEWIKDVYQTQLPLNYPKIKAILWFNENKEADWRIESSSSAQAAYSYVVASGRYTNNSYAELSTSPIPPPQAAVTCVPNWKCESPLNGYEYDGCGGRRSNSACAIPSPAPQPIDNPPSVSASHTPASPTPSDTVTITASASASDDKGLSQITVYADNAAKVTCSVSGTSASCPYGSTFAAGTHSYYATAKDTAEALTTSSIKSFTVSAPVPSGTTLADATDNNLQWTTGGNAKWFGETGTYYYGNDAAQSGKIGDSQITWLQTTVAGPGKVTFYWKVSSEQYYDYLKFYVDGLLKAKISGSVSWNSKSYPLTSGTHTLKWAYAKDRNMVRGSDAGWVDKVVYTPSTSPTGYFLFNRK